MYRRFPTKEALFEAVILDRVQQLADRARALTAAERPGAAFFEFVAHMTRESAAKKDLIDALGGIGIAVTANLAEVNRDLWDAIGELLTPGPADR